MIPTPNLPIWLCQDKLGAGYAVDPRCSDKNYSGPVLACCELPTSLLPQPTFLTCCNAHPSQRMWLSVIWAPSWLPSRPHAGTLEHQCLISSASLAHRDHSYHRAWPSETVKELAWHHKPEPGCPGTLSVQQAHLPTSSHLVI